MAKKRTVGEQRPGPLAPALIAAGCFTVIAIALWAPVARAQLILSTLPALIAIAATWFRPRRRQ
jgi:drug/metabolite transporter (DMT)-like permease